MTQQYHLASMAAWLSSTGISHHNLLPHNSSIHPWQSTAALTLGSLHNPQTLRPCPGMYGCGKDCLILIPFRLPQISCFTLSLKCFSSDSELARCGAQTPASVPPPAQGRSSPTHTPVSPQFLVLLSFACVYSFPLVRDSCPLSAGVLHALLCLKVYSWCIRGEEVDSMSTYSSGILFSLSF